MTTISGHLVSPDRSPWERRLRFRMRRHSNRWGFGGQRNTTDLLLYFPLSGLYFSLLGFSFILAADHHRCRFIIAIRVDVITRNGALAVVPCLAGGWYRRRSLQPGVCMRPLLFRALREHGLIKKGMCSGEDDIIWTTHKYPALSSWVGP